MALSFLEKNKIFFIRKEITEERPSLAELKRMCDYAKGDVRKLFNSSGQLYREFQLAEKLNEMSLSECFSLLNQHGMLIKRPFLLGENIGLLGFKETEWSQSLKLLNLKL
jgi:arsenate reductase